MKVLLARLATSGALVLGSAVLLAAPASANPGPYAAIHNNGFDCVGFDGDGNLGGAFGTVSREVIRSSGGVVLKCKFQTTPSSTGKAAVFTFENTGVYCASDGP